LTQHTHDALAQLYDKRPLLFRTIVIPSERGWVNLGNVMNISEWMLQRHEFDITGTR
jgi:hypothetical protein